MLEFPRWKYALIVLVVLVSAWFALPNIFPSDPSVQITPNRGFAIDDALVSRVNTSLKAVGITPLAVDKQAESLLVRLSGVDLQTKANDALRDDLGEDYTVALSLASTVPEWMLGAKPMTLGLDLRGGVHFVMQVDQKAALDKRIDAYAEDMRVTLRDKRVRYESVERAANNGDEALALRVEVGRPGVQRRRDRGGRSRRRPGLTLNVLDGEHGEALRLHRVECDGEVRRRDRGIAVEPASE